MDLWTVVWNFVFLIAGTGVGGGISYIVSWHYFRKASEDLDAKVLRLELIVTLMARYLENNGVIRDVELDERGVLKGYTQTIHVPPLTSEQRSSRLLPQEEIVGENRPRQLRT